MNRHPWFRNAAYVVVGVGVAAIVLVVVVGVVLIRSTQTQNTALVEKVADLSSRIESCTSPGGKCYQDAQRQTTDIVGVPRGPINTVTVLATYCQLTKGADTVPEILDCVDSQLAHLAGQPIR